MDLGRGGHLQFPLPDLGVMLHATAVCINALSSTRRALAPVTGCRVVHQQLPGWPNTTLQMLATGTALLVAFG
jgi:hypothetical protein